MQQYKEQFIEFLVRSGALKFGDFILKGGRKCPYFLNLGQFYKGSLISELGRYYAQALYKNVKPYDVIFGPAYKGIPLSVVTVVELFKQFGEDKAYSFNRKEAKDHGEGGILVGAPITHDSRVVIVDDVMTAGTALRESLSFLKKVGNPIISGVLIAVDRMERGQGVRAKYEPEASLLERGAELVKKKSALQEVKEEFGISVYAIVTIEEIVSYLHGRDVDGVVVIDDFRFKAIQAYRKEYGVS